MGIKLTKKEWIINSNKIHNNFYDYSKVEYNGSQKKVIIICPEHGEFEQRADGHMQGRGCKKCGIKKQIKSSLKSQEQFIKDCEKKHNNFYDYSKIKYKGVQEKIIIICPEHGEFEQLANAHLQGSGCPKCSVLKVALKHKKSKEQFINEAKIKHNNFYDYSKTEYIGSEQKIIIICPDHGEFKQTASTHLQGSGCPSCPKITSTQWLIDVNLKHNNKYIYPEKYISSLQHMLIICPEHGEFKKIAYQHKQGQGCPQCAKNNSSLKLTKTHEQWLFELNKKHNNFYNYNETIFNSKQKIKIKCPKHGDFIQRVDMHLFGSGCPQCAFELQTSKAELEIIDFIKELGINNIEQSNRKILNGYELDIYLPDYNFAIEYNGNYWHTEEFKEDNHHFQKTNECLNKGIKLIHIFEDEWLLKKEIVKSRLLNLLNKIPSDHKIYARNCFIKEISSEEAKKFTERNHLQGFVGAKIHLGLFTIINNKEYMVSYMSFGSLRKNLGQINNNQYSFELLRFCSVINYSVIGAANKLLKYFEKNYNPNYLISYADRRWSQGKIYEKLNFVQSHISKPNYFYINPQTPLKRENRFNYRKDILISKYGCKPEYTENYFTTEILGLKRIYDSGNLVFVKEYK